MIYLITGVPGAGKTLRAVELIDGWVREGRPVYARIDGLGIEGVKPAPDDWRETPHGSVVVYDEAQQLFGAEGARAGRSNRDDIQAMETHRHSGHDIVLVTQHPSLIHSHVRRLVGRHEHVQRVFGSKRVVIAWGDRACDVDSKSERMQAVTQPWFHPARLFPVYRSASLHTTKTRIPGKVKFYAGFAVVMLGVLGWCVAQLVEQGGVAPSPMTALEDGIEAGQTVAMAPAASSGSARVEQAVTPADPWEAEQVVGGCVSMANQGPSGWRCRCFAPDGTPIKMELFACLAFVKQPLHYKLPSLQLEATQTARADARQEYAGDAQEPPRTERSDLAAAPALPVVPVSLPAAGGGWELEPQPGSGGGGASPGGQGAALGSPAGVGVSSASRRVLGQ
jgi:hypothetical protein